MVPETDNCTSARDSLSGIAKLHPTRWTAGTSTRRITHAVDRPPTEKMSDETLETQGTWQERPQPRRHAPVRRE
jgi:hypothetical protein